MHEIAFSDSESILHLKLSGFWDEAAFGRFVADMQQHIAPLRAVRQPFGVLSDSSGLPVQSAVMAERFACLALEARRRFPVPTAIIVGSVLHKLQIQRVLTDDGIQVFLSEADARTWLAQQLH